MLTVDTIPIVVSGTKPASPGKLIEQEIGNNKAGSPSASEQMARAEPTGAQRPSLTAFE
jgi:hypothetical protein